jgi:hypothetical protein
MAAVSSEVTTQLNAYMDQTHGQKVDYKCSVIAVSGNATDTVFHYTCIVPLSDHPSAMAGMQQCCTNQQVIHSSISTFLSL